jgi:uncharacterized protein Yka (UPF0111/DUF47 family)
MTPTASTRALTGSTSCRSTARILTTSPPASGAVSFRANERREHAIRLARTLLEATQEIEQAITHIRDAGAVLERSRAIKAREERGDELYAEAVTELFAGYPNPIDVLRWKAIYDELEEALNASDDVANALETITVKHG